eukprot:s674_g16.t1
MFFHFLDIFPGLVGNLKSHFVLVVSLAIHASLRDLFKREIASQFLSSIDFGVTNAKNRGLKILLAVAKVLEYQTERLHAFPPQHGSLDG